MMEAKVWTANKVIDAVSQGNPNLEILLSNYFREVIAHLSDFEISDREVNSIEVLNQKVLEGIEALEKLRVEILSVVDAFSVGKPSLLTGLLPDFFERLLNYYEERDINLYTGHNPELLRNDHFRFFNQFLFISLTELLVDNQSFLPLIAIIHTKYRVLYKSFGALREVNFIRLRGYNYTLNYYCNTGSPKRISVTADYIRKYSSQSVFQKLVRADILLYYLSLWYHTNDPMDDIWYPELSVYNRDSQILPYLASKRYFERIKGLFGADTIDSFKALLENTMDSLPRSGIYKVPELKVGLLYDSVGSID